MKLEEYGLVVSIDSKQYYINSPQDIENIDLNLYTGRISYHNHYAITIYKTGNAYHIYELDNQTTIENLWNTIQTVRKEIIKINENL